MRVLYIKESNCTLHKTGEAILARKKGYKINTYPLCDVNHIVLYGNTHITAPLIEFCFKNGIDVSYLSMSGRLRGRISSIKSSNIILRMAQYEKFKEDRFRMNFAREITKKKIRNQIVVLEKYAKNISNPIIRKNIGHLKLNIKNIDKSNNINSIRGIEGISSKQYFECFEIISTKHDFKKRERRPAKDKFNSLLNLTYALVANECCSRLEHYGFDIELGFFHGIRYGRNSLAFDVMEEFRPIFADSLVLKIINLKILDDKDFDEDLEKGIILKRESFKKYLDNYHKEINEVIRTNKNFYELLNDNIRRLRAEVLS